MEDKAAPCDAVPKVKLMKRIRVPILNSLKGKTWLLSIIILPLHFLMRYTHIHSHIHTHIHIHIQRLITQSYT